VRTIVCRLKTVKLMRHSSVNVSALDEAGYSLPSKVSFISIDFVASFRTRSFDVFASRQRQFRQ